MLKIYILNTLIFLCIAIASSAQNNDFSDTVYYINNGQITRKKFAEYYRIPIKIHGDMYYAEYYNSKGKILLKANFITPKLTVNAFGKVKTSLKDTLHGYSIYYNDSGKIVSEGNFIKDKKNGYWKYYYKNGKVSMTEEYSEEQPVCYVKYFDTTGILISKEGYNLLIYTGKYKRYLKQGTWIYYYNNSDKISRAIDYDRGLLHGYSTYYDSTTGKKIAEGNFLYNKKEGSWKYYNMETGGVRKIESYKKGLLDGPYSVWYDSTKIKLTGYFSEGLPNDAFKIYYDNSDLLFALIRYERQNGHAEYYDSLTSMKILEGSINYDGKYGSWFRYYPGTNRLMSKEDYQNNMLHGLMTEYNMEGDVIATTNYFQGRKDGSSIMYFEGTNKKWIELYFNDDSLNNEQYVYYPSNKVKRIEYYKYNVWERGVCYDEIGNEIEYTPFKILPKFDGNVMTYIGNNLKYPPEAVDAGIEGKVSVGFMVNENGRISDVTLLKGIDPQCDEEAIRLIQQMPPWIPAQIDGVPYKMYQTLPIVFWIH